MDLQQNVFLLHWQPPLVSVHSLPKLLMSPNSLASLLPQNSWNNGFSVRLALQAHVLWLTAVFSSTTSGSFTFSSGILVSSESEDKVTSLVKRPSFHFRQDGGSFSFPTLTILGTAWKAVLDLPDMMTMSPLRMYKAAKIKQIICTSKFPRWDGFVPVQNWILLVDKKKLITAVKSWFLEPPREQIWVWKSWGLKIKVTRKCMQSTLTVTESSYCTL